MLAQMQRPIAVCADESAHDRSSLATLAGKYDAVNIKLDKAGGLTEALAVAAEAQRQNFTIMIGCMVATSLAMAPAMLLAQTARFVDLDGPLLLSKDRADGLRYVDSLVYPPSSSLWGLRPLELTDRLPAPATVHRAKTAVPFNTPEFVHEMCPASWRGAQNF